MGVMWHSGRLWPSLSIIQFTDLHGCDVALRVTEFGACYDLFYFTDLHACDVALWVPECGLL